MELPISSTGCSYLQTYIYCKYYFKISSKVHSAQFCEKLTKSTLFELSINFEF